MMKLLARVGIDTFILLLLGMILLAYLFPAGGVGEGPWSLSSLSGYGVSLIFFFYGLKLNFAEIASGLRNWKLHVLVHLSTFVLFPLILLSCKSLVSPEAFPLWLGAFFLATLPSTVSSSVVMVSVAEGNIPAAIFNASISSMMGVFITPLWMSFVSVGLSGDVYLSRVLIKLVLQVLAPLMLGIVLNKKWGSWAKSKKKELKYFDQTIILSIVYTSFCESFALQMFSSIGLADLLILALSMLVLFFLVYFLIKAVAGVLKLNREDTITATFCGSKKSLVHGAAMSKLLFAKSNNIGVLLLPLMLYHALQLIVISMMAQRMAKTKTAS